MIKIKSFIESSFLDWDGKISSVIFLPGCNLRCIYCHNYKLVFSSEELPDLSWNEIKNFLILHKKWIDGVCITGGEPCLQDELEEFLKELKKENFLIKLDTNGCYPKKIEEIINKNLIDYAAMDIKAPLNEKYEEITGIAVNMESIKETIGILHQSKIQYEFRTTLVPGFLGMEELKNIAGLLNKNDKYVLQNFKPSNALSEKLRKLNSFEENQMNSFLKECKKIVENCLVR